MNLVRIKFSGAIKEFCFKIVKFVQMVKNLNLPNHSNNILFKDSFPVG